MSTLRVASVLCLSASLLVHGGCCRLADQSSSGPPPSASPAKPDPAMPTPEAPRGAGDEGVVVPTTPAALGVDAKLARNFYVVFDGSGSMREKSCGGKFGRKLPAAQWAFKEFLNAVGQDDNLGMLVFDKKRLREVVPIGSGNREQVERAVDAVDAGEGTPLGPAVRLALQALQQQQERQLGYGEYHLVVVTDGRADDARDLKKAVQAANKAGVLIHTIGFCIAADSDLKTASYSFRTANDPEELRAAVVGVLAESEDFQPVAFEQVH